MGWRRKTVIGIGVAAAFMLAPWAIISLILIARPMLAPRPGSIQTGTLFDRISPGMALADVEAILGPGQRVNANDVVAAMADRRASAKRRSKPIKIDETLDFRLWSSSAGQLYVGFRQGRVDTRVVHLR